MKSALLKGGGLFNPPEKNVCLWHTIQKERGQRLAAGGKMGRNIPAVNGKRLTN
jgi:hypothetical protein